MDGVKDSEDSLLEETAAVYAELDVESIKTELNRNVEAFVTHIAELDGKNLEIGPLVFGTHGLT